MRFSFFLPLWAIILSLVIATGITIFFYLRLKHPLSKILRTTLITLRFVAITILLSCLLAPVIIERKDVTPPTHFSILVDTSSSMQLEDDYNGVSDISRIDQVNQLLFTESNQFLQKLQKEYSIHLHGFDTSLNQSHIVGEEFVADGKLTNLSKAITEAEKTTKGHPNAGILLITDGSHNASKFPLNKIVDLSIPIYAIGVGALSPPKDIQIQNIETPPIAHTGHETIIRITVIQSGYTTKSTRLSLRETETNKLIDAEILTFEDGTSNENITLIKGQGVIQGTKHIVDLKVTPESEGTFQYKIVLPAYDDELTDENNVKTISLKVIKAKLNVLYLEGRPRWEYTFLKRTLERDPDLNPTFAVLSKNIRQNTVLANEDGYYPQQNKQITQFPNTLQDLTKYDILILGDITDQHLTTTQQQSIVNFIEDRGKSVVFLPSYNALGNTGYRKSKINQILPIQIPQNGCTERDADNFLNLTQFGSYHPMMQLSDTLEGNSNIWNNLPPLSKVFQGFQLKAGATPLLEIQNIGPIMIFQRVGLGKSLLFTAEGLWNWHFGVNTYKNEDLQNTYPRLWAQILRWMAQQSDDDTIYISSDAPTYNQGDMAKIRVNAYSPTFQPQNNADIQIFVTAPNGAQFPLQSQSEFDNNSASQGNSFIAKLIVDEIGTYRLSAKGTLGNIPLGEDNIEINVQPQLIELESPQLNENLLKLLAEQTNGVYLTIDDADKLPDSINSEQKPVFVDEERDLWAHPLILISIVGLLGTEWFLRKRIGLT
ncbi:hypothetical protein JT359_05630 [Candidatus Poribacteria bacterium]|nr:hypothetical protein [Candidatus Poribacteria bacterium]